MTPFENSFSHVPVKSSTNDIIEDMPVGDNYLRMAYCPGLKRMMCVHGPKLNSPKLPSPKFMNPHEDFNMLLPFSDLNVPKLLSPMAEQQPKFDFHCIHQALSGTSPSQVVSE